MKTTILLASLFVSSLAFGTDRVFECTADLSKWGQGGPKGLKIEIQKDGDRLNAFLDGKLYRENAQLRTATIRENLDLNMDIGSEAAQTLNEGEFSLLFLSLQKNDPIFAGKLVLEIDLKAIKSVKMYDLEEDSRENMFGGALVVEAYDKDGLMIGRVLRGIISGDCK